MPSNQVKASFKVSPETLRLLECLVNKATAIDSGTTYEIALTSMLQLFGNSFSALSGALKELAQEKIKVSYGDQFIQFPVFFRADGGPEQPVFFYRFNEHFVRFKTEHSELAAQVLSHNLPVIH